MTTIKLTDAFVKQLRCDEQKSTTEIRDSEVRGLEIRAARAGTKSWRLHYTRRSDGKRRAVTLGRYPAVSLKEARTKARMLQASIEDVETRADPAARRRELRIAESFADLTDEWLERHARPNKVARAVADDLSMLRRHILPHLGPLKVKQIRKRDVVQMLDRVANTPDARRNREALRPMSHRPNRVFELVRAIFRWAVSRDLIETDPTSGLTPPIKKERPRERDLSHDEICRLWRVLSQAPTSRSQRRSGDLPIAKSTALTIKLALVTGQRIGEVVGINKTELQLEDPDPIWTLPTDRSKNSLANRVPLSPLAIDLIQEAHRLSKGSEWLFPNPRKVGSINAHAPTRALARARPMIGLDDFRIHDLRRTAATGMAKLGIAPHTISLILNHASARSSSITSKVYVQYSYDREKREALNAWSDRLAAIVSQCPQ